MRKIIFLTILGLLTCNISYAAKEVAKDSSKPKYYANGKIMQETICRNDNDCVLKEYYPSGKLKREIPYVNGIIPDGGASKTYYESGALMSITEYNHGKPNGKDFRYYENGQLADEGYYKDGKKTGIRRLYREDGTIESETKE
jgi:antitoxin component YwqK of YwqJK toxin-antitoxin module